MKFRKGYKYQLHADEVFHTKIMPAERIETRFITLETGGTLTIRAGYAWDGPSGPTWDTPDTMAPSAYHDAIYQLIRMGLLDPHWRPFADEEMGEMMKARAVKWQPLKAIQHYRANAWVRQLKNFGGPAADPKNKKPILEAP